jgi:hypothetical protein
MQFRHDDIRLEDRAETTLGAAARRNAAAQAVVWRVDFDASQAPAPAATRTQRDAVPDHANSLGRRLAGVRERNRRDQLRDATTQRHAPRA